MPPSGKTLQSMGCDFQRQNTGKDKCRNGKGHGTHTAGAEVSNHKERAEENQRSTKVIHQRKAAADGHGIADKQDQVTLCHDPVHGGRADKHKAHLTQLRRLDGQ